MTGEVAQERRGRGVPVPERRSGDRRAVVPGVSVDDLPDVLTTDEAAALLRRSSETILRYVEAGVIPGRKTPGGWLFTKRALMKWLEGE